MRRAKRKKKHFVLHSFVCARARKEIIDSFFSASKMYCCAKENEKEYRLCWPKFIDSIHKQFTSMMTRDANKRKRSIIYNRTLCWYYSRFDRTLVLTVFSLKMSIWRTSQKLFSKFGDGLEYYRCPSNTQKITPTDTLYFHLSTSISYLLSMHGISLIRFAKFNKIRNRIEIDGNENVTISKMSKIKTKEKIK